MIWYPTGKTRFRPLVQSDIVLLVLQVEERPGGLSPVPVRWRDAKVEDLRGKEVEVKA